MNCHSNVATIKFTRFTEGGVDERYLCRQCAAAESPYQKSALPQLDEILSGLLGSAGVNMENRSSVTSVELNCSNCGLPYASYRESLILGCSGCYESFEKQLLIDLKRFHGALEHKGRVPNSQASHVESFRNAEDLRKRLREAVTAEDFVLAVKLRDQLKSAEETLADTEDVSTDKDALRDTPEK